MAIFQELNRLGKTVVLITHDSAVAKMAKRVVEIVDGTIVSDTLVEEPGDAARELESLPEKGGQA
jgi:putative ABC transport system ATP-binding protein